ncbi:MAG: 3-oxoacyl-ACP synthase, partial [Bacteroidaceae bacterium]|nr:3-oxoacyl-ACP synthase [Bacteroidaceae bacterium]
MATVITDNILSPLGFTAQETLAAVKSGKSALRHHESAQGVPFAFMTSQFSPEQTAALRVAGYTRFESLAIRSIQTALSNCNFDRRRAVLIVSSTKGNVEDLLSFGNEPHVVSLGVAAQRIAGATGFSNSPIVVSNACISGVSAILLAQRLVDAGDYDHAVVCGVDVQSPFILSGFQALKAMSAEACRPFDIERVGLNLGEAAATLVLSGENDDTEAWTVVGGAIRNDAYHLSSPSPKGVGSLHAIR